jgi:hypothetical protein
VTDSLAWSIREWGRSLMSTGEYALSAPFLRVRKLDQLNREEQQG